MIHFQETGFWLPGQFSLHLKVISIKTFWKAEEIFQWAGLMPRTMTITVFLRPCF